MTLARLWALLLAVLGSLPIANWIAGGHAAPWYATVLSEWVSGSAIGVGVAVVLFLVLRRFDRWPSGWLRGADVAAARPGWTAFLLGIGAVLLYAVVAVTVLAGRPLLIDEIVQVMQAQIFAEGRLSRPADAAPEFFSALHVVDLRDRVFSQFPPGGPLMLVPFVLAGAAWLAGPFFGSIAVVAYWHLARRTDAPAVALGAALLFALAPFLVFMAGSHMNHVPTLAWFCLALVALHAVTSGRDRAGPALGLGLCLGMMVAIRPVDGAAFAVPAGVWLVTRTVRGTTSLATLLSSGVGVVLPVAGVLAYNQATTGDPFLFGYELLWGASHGLGFHAAPWGITHTPARGLELVNLYFLRLQTYLFETPLPSLVPATVALALARRVSAMDRYLLASSALLVLGYFAYWHDGFFLGPRFLYLLLPLLVLWTARLPSIVRERFANGGLDRFVLLTYAVCAAVAVTLSVPVRARQYANGLLNLRHDYLEPARVAGVNSAVILVRESWGAQLIARLHALQVSRSDAEAIYRTVDACLLDSTIASLEREGIRSDGALSRLRPLTADSLRLVSGAASPDVTLRVQPGAMYSSLCQRRLLEDRAGYTLYAPLLARDPGTNVYARDLHARDTVLLARYRDRPVFLLRTRSSAVGAPLFLEPLNGDSARAEWAASAMAR